MVVEGQSGLYFEPINAGMELLFFFFSDFGQRLPRERERELTSWLCWRAREELGETAFEFSYKAMEISREAHQNIRREFILAAMRVCVCIAYETAAVGGFHERGGRIPLDWPATLEPIEQSHRARAKYVRRSET